MVYEVTKPNSHRTIKMIAIVSSILLSSTVINLRRSKPEEHPWLNTTKAVCRTSIDPSKSIDEFAAATLRLFSTTLSHFAPGSV